MIGDIPCGWERQDKTRIAGQPREEAGPRPDHTRFFSRPGDLPGHLQKRLLGGQRGVTSRMFCLHALSVKSTLPEMRVCTRRILRCRGSGLGARHVEMTGRMKKCHGSDWRCHRGDPGAVRESAPRLPIHVRHCLFPSPASLPPPLWELL